MGAGDGPSLGGEPREAVLARQLREEILTVVATCVAPPGHPDMKAFRIEKVEVDPRHVSVTYTGEPFGPRRDSDHSYSADRGDVVRAAVLTLSRRARRLASGESYGTDPRDWVAALSARHPRWFECEVSCGPGWADLLFVLARQVANLQPLGGFHFSQVKEKYGTLRAYHYGGDVLEMFLIPAFEIVSGAICETCGAPGVLRGRQGGYFHTACDEHARAPKATDDDGEGWP